jgi:hypothetical protein
MLAWGQEEHIPWRGYRKVDEKYIGYMLFKMPAQRLLASSMGLPHGSSA